MFTELGTYLSMEGWVRCVIHTVSLYSTCVYLFSELAVIPCRDEGWGFSECLFGSKRLNIPFLSLAVSILSKLWQLFQFKKWTKDREVLICKSLLEERLWEIREEEIQLRDLSFAMVISILFKFTGLRETCFMFELALNYLQAEKLQGVWDLPSEHSK